MPFDSENGSGLYLFFLFFPSQPFGISLPFIEHPLPPHADLSFPALNTAAGLRNFKPKFTISISHIIISSLAMFISDKASWKRRKPAIVPPLSAIQRTSILALTWVNASFVSNVPPKPAHCLEGVIAENRKHDYGYTLMALAEDLSALGETDAALNVWKQVTEHHSYPRAKVQLAEIYLQKRPARTCPRRTKRSHFR